VKRVLRRALALAAAAVLAAPPAGASPDAPTEWEVKAAYLYNFTRFVDWPDDAMQSATAPFVVGLFGPDPFGSVLDTTFAGKAVGSHPIVVRRLKAPEEAASVQILFLAAAPDRESLRAIRAAQGRPVLVVGDGDGATRRGVILTFQVKDNRVRFEVNLAPAREAGLKISSQLLKLALAVEGP
jgi:hypothetical protein